MRWVWATAGLISLGLGIIGAFVPLLPTVPLVLLAAFCFARSSERLHAWLLDHPRFGPPIAQWRSRGAISRRGKWAATISVALAFGLSVLLGVRPLILGIQAAVLGCVMLFIWTRPDS